MAFRNQDWIPAFAGMTVHECSPTYAPINKQIATPCTQNEHESIEVTQES